MVLGSLLNGFEPNRQVASSDDYRMLFLIRFPESTYICIIKPEWPKFLEKQESNEEVEKDIFIPFIHRPLSRYINALIANGLYIQRMLEPLATKRRQ